MIFTRGSGKLFVHLNIASAACMMLNKLLICLYYCSVILLQEFNALSAAGKALQTSKFEEQTRYDDKSSIVDSLNKSVQSYLLSGDLASAEECLKNINEILLGKYYVDSLKISDSHYYNGVFCLLKGSFKEGVEYLGLSAQIREKLGKLDPLYVKCLYNLGAGYSYLGDFRRMNEFSGKSVNAGKILYGESSPELLKGLTNLVIAKMNLKEYEESINYANEAVSILLREGKGSLTESDISDLYLNIGVCYHRLADYTKALVYLEKAEYSYREGLIPKDERYVNLLNSLAVLYGLTGMTEKSAEYYEKGIKLSESFSSALSLNLINSYAILLGNSGNTEKGAKLLENALLKAEKTFGLSSRDYVGVLRNYAEYLRTFNIDTKKSLELYERCYSYINQHKEDTFLRDQILTGYSLALSQNGNSQKALEIVQNLLFAGIPARGKSLLPENPDPEQLQPDQRTLSALRAKYRILWDIFLKNNDIGYLKLIANTSELIINVLEKLRINISQEESRIILGDRYRDSYLFAIRDLNLCYQRTNDPSFLEKAFMYSEKSKVAGLLASTRELKAVQLHIPSDLASTEQSIQNEIGLISAEIFEEKNRQAPDVNAIDEMNNKLIKLSRERDSLVKLFEMNYTEYYQLKYNTEAIAIDRVTKVIGKNSNYLSYVISDSLVYIFIVNRKNYRLVTVPVNEEFFNNVRQFRSLLTKPSLNNNAGNEFRQFTAIGFKLYKTLLMPAEKYLVSDRLVISPDNILSYIPFEILPADEYISEGIHYNKLRYVMKSYSVSYLYSATFMAVSEKGGSGLSNNLVAFAPVYEKNITIENAFQNGRRNDMLLKDIPYAREEAGIITALTKGTLYAGPDAKESVFKSEAPKYDIIHLAMHTVINDQSPMHSRMLFYSGDDQEEDNVLNTYEVYGIHLKAKMVVLSSCNTGIGALHSGEGIISLARGFMYSGSRSVVLSMWEVEDKSATDIVEKYYSFLRRGRTKSEALRLARQNYIKRADMLHSHPYFWATLVVYGNNRPVYYNYHILVACIMVLIAAGTIVIYRRFR